MSLRLLLLILIIVPLLRAADPLDTLVFGDAASEQAHALDAGRSEIIRGALDEPARRLLPNAPATWDGGVIAFTVRVDPQQPTYLTLPLWGGDVNRNRLARFVDGKQVGYRRLGDIEILDVGSEEPATPRRYFYRTTPLPTTLTAGHREVRCEIRASGPLWGYGRDFAQYQHAMETASRGIYRVHNFGFANGGMRYPGDLHSANADEELPIAKVPGGLPFTPGQENIHAGRGTFYRLAYGRYLIGMNMGAREPQRLVFPAGMRQARDLISGRILTAEADGGVSVPPRTTVVLLTAGS